MTAVPFRHVRLAATIALVAVIPAALLAQLRPLPLTPFERAVIVTRPGPQRLSADVALVAGAMRGRREAAVAWPDSAYHVVEPFADLRLYDADGREVPYLLVPPQLQRATAVRASQVLALPATKTTSGFEAVFDTPHTFDEIVVAAGPPPFVKRVRVEGSVDRLRWVELAADATIFSLPQEDLRLTAIAVPPTPVRFVRVVFDNANSAPLRDAPFVTGRPAPAAAPPPALEVALPFERVDGPAGTSAYRVRLPGPRLPLVAVRLDATNAEVSRQVRIVERPPEAAGMPVALGHGQLTRVVRGQLVAGSLTVPIAAPSTAALDVLVEDGANPPLSLSSVHVVFAHLPRLYFETADARPLVARYGSATAVAPRYDLEAARRLIDVEAAADATWGEPAPATAAPPAGSTAPDPAVARPVAPLPTPVPVFAGPVDRAAFRFARTLAPGPGALTRVSLDAAVLAHSASRGHSFADLRLVDPEGRQVPYVLSREDQPLQMALAVPGATRAPQAPQTSIYALDLPEAGLPGAALVLTTSARVFTRRVTLAAEQAPDARHRDPWTQPLGSTSWSHQDASQDALPLRMAVPTLTGRRVVVTIDEGDNQPIPLQDARLELPAYALRFVRPADTALELVYGHPRLGAPRYDLAPVLLEPSTPTVAATLGEERTLSGPPQPAIVTPPMFWAVLGVATLVLLIMFARLVRTSDDGPVAPGPGA